ncbi:MAG: DUF1824 family protein [Chitinophagaceae bacterium]|nr:DUF1824 family protein [Chitinophagaceae bacterium]
MNRGLAALRGLRSAPTDLDHPARAALRVELEPLLARCEWFTVGVMAPTALQALVALRQLEDALGWPALDLDPACEQLDASEGPVFLKGNQTTGRFQVRCEAGLGEGLLISGHSSADPEAADTWGPLPLDFFGP